MLKSYMFKIETGRPRNFNKSFDPKNKEQIERQITYSKNSKLAVEIIESLPKDIEYPLYKFDQKKNKDVVVEHVVLLSQNSTEVLTVLYKNANTRKPMTKIHFCRDTRFLIKQENSEAYIPNQELIDKYTEKDISNTTQTTSNRLILD